MTIKLLLYCHEYSSALGLLEAAPGAAAGAAPTARPSSSPGPGLDPVLADKNTGQTGAVAHFCHFLMLNK